MESLRVPFYGQFSTRQYNFNVDSRFKNCYPEKLLSGGEKPLTYVVKRPGMESAYSTTVATGRGMYGWKGSLYSVLGNQVYKNGSALSGTLNNSTGRCHFTEVKGGTPRLVIQDNDDIWTVNTSDTLAESTDGDIPANQVPGIVNIDGYVCVMNTDNEIYHFDVNDPTALDPLSKITASLEPDDGVGLTKHLNFVVAFGEWSTEFFYDAGNSSGSVLSKVDGSAIRYGCAEGNTIFSDENTVIWVAQGRTGGLSVMILDGLTPKIISTKPIERLLNEEKNNISNAYSFGLRIGGKIHYCITLPTTAQKTIAYDMVDKVWWELNSDPGTESYFTGIAHASINDQNYILDEDDGTIYRMDVDLYQDVGNDINVEIVTNKIDFNTVKTKFLPRWSLIGDEQTSSSTVTVDWTNDDYNNFSTARTVDMQDSDPYLTGLGSFTRRAFRLKHTANTPLRLEAMEFGLNAGEYSI